MDSRIVKVELSSEIVPYWVQAFHLITTGVSDQCPPLGSGAIAD